MDDKKSNKARAIMVQGTMSNAGKSLLVAALCRIFRQDGYRVAPFKSQNMALNSYITRDGLEMGRAQVVQALSAGIEPSVLMNPILLKPTNNTGSQVIIKGEPIGNMSASEYYKKKQSFIPDILESYEALAAENDIIVIEGAGSPAEINLKENDIVNMGLAKLVKAPVLLVGDIDRGGVFAQLLGTVEWLEEEEKRLLKGMIINKFRGDVTLLNPGIKMLTDRVNYPVLGVVPYVKVDIEDEDSLSSRLENNKAVKPVTIGVVRLPKISNFTDFNVFETYDVCLVKYITRPEELETADMIILPGTKNTIEDLLYLRQSGLEAEILKQASKGKVIFGICGGYQMLGESVSDPEGVEHRGTLTGLGLLPVKTVYKNEKTRRQLQGSFGLVGGKLSGLSNMNITGYEIHMGQSQGEFNLTMDENSMPEGCQSGNVYGTYIHGIFDEGQVAETVIKALLMEKGMDLSLLKGQAVDYVAYREKQFDILADEVRHALDMDEIYKIIFEGV